MNSAKKVVIGGILFVVIGFAALLMLGIFIASRQSNDQASSAEIVPATRDEVFKLVNDERIKVGVAPLKVDERLNQSAQQKADDMRMNNYYDHESQLDHIKGTDLIFAKTGKTCGYASENLNKGGGVFSTSSEIVKGWMNSDAHRTALLDSKYTLSGVGVSSSSDGETIVVQHFCQTQKFCDDVTSIDYNWDNDVRCTRQDGTSFYTNYENAKSFLAS